MGLLDDAIREHLELKRRRGADLAEVARQEDEALGDPRAQEAAASEPEAPAAESVAEEAPPDEPAAREPAPAAEPEAGPEPDPAVATWLEDDDDRIGAVASQRTAEFTPPDVEPDPEPAPSAAEPAVDEDVLEETPEFLQETPEHDRLWFEQKPPRDFDFDK
jgi:hypothetical protein